MSMSELTPKSSEILNIPIATTKQDSNNRMPSAIILLADGSEEIEFVTPYDGTIPFLPIENTPPNTDIMSQS